MQSYEKDFNFATKVIKNVYNTDEISIFSFFFCNFATILRILLGYKERTKNAFITKWKRNSEK